MTRPAITRRNIRRNQPAHKIRRWWIEQTIGAAVIVGLFVTIASIDSLIP